MAIKRICVYCGSRNGVVPAYQEAARELGKAMAKRKIGLVFGGGTVGLMGVIADSILEYGGEAHGVIPEHLMRREIAHKGLTALHITKTMHERKALMAELSDAFIALPGGFGTLEELFETITWIQLKIHKKPIVVYNTEGYYDKLAEFIGQVIDNGFITADNGPIFKVAASIEECFHLLEV